MKYVEDLQPVILLLEKEKQEKRKAAGGHPVLSLYDIEGGMEIPQLTHEKIASNAGYQSPENSAVHKDTSQIR